MSHQITSQGVTVVGLPSSRSFFPLRKQDVIMAWAAISEFLRGRKGSFMDKWDEETFKAELIANPEMFLWVGHNGLEIEGLMLVCFSTTPKEKLLWITGVYCDRIKDYLPLHKNLESWAIMCGAAGVVFEGAHSWARLLRKYGYSTPTAMLKKDLRSMWRN